MYYFRRGVPSDIRHLFPTASGKPRTEWRWSLGVKDREAAKRLLPSNIEKTNQWRDQARAAIARVATEARHAPSDVQLIRSQNIADEMSRASEEAAEVFYKQDREDEWRAESDPSFAQELELREERGLEIRQLREARQNREFALEIRSARQLCLLELFEVFAIGRHQKTVAQWRPYVRSLTDHAGHTDAHALTDKQIIAWRNHLRDGVTYRGRPLSAKTINGSYMAAVSTLLSWAKGDGLIDHNPMLGVGKVKGVKAQRLRPNEFTRDEAQLILKASLADVAGRPLEEWRNARRWCPWLMAYSGARVNEITQLRSEDIVEIDGIWVMRLTPEAGTIKTNEARLVPLHRDLVGAGFVSFAQGRASGPLFYDPSKRRSNNAINRQANRLGSKLAEWVTSLGISGVKPNHAWRHLFNTLAVEHGLDHRSTLAILGHSAGNVNQSYGSVPVSRLAIEIEKLPCFQVGD